jgi:hypothetical protein
VTMINRAAANFNWSRRRHAGRAGGYGVFAVGTEDCFVAKKFRSRGVAPTLRLRNS